MEPFRGQQFRPPCARCGEPADVACVRCDWPLCARHPAGPDGLCERCEADFSAATRDLATELAIAAEPARRRNSAIALAVTVGAVIAFSALGYRYGGGLFAAIVAILSGGALAGPAGSAALELLRTHRGSPMRRELARRRRRFLGEKRPRALPPAPHRSA